MSLLYSGHTLIHCHFSTCAYCWVSHFSHSFSFYNSVRGRRHTEERGKKRSFFLVPAFTCSLSSKAKPISSAAAQHKRAQEAEVLDVKCSWHELLNAHDRAPARCNFLKGSQWEWIWQSFLKIHIRDISDAKATAATKCKLLFLTRGVQKHLKKPQKDTWWHEFLTE